MTHPAIEFLKKLDGSEEATFNIEVYTDTSKDEEKPKPDPLLKRWPNLTCSEVEQIIPELTKRNSNGGGIFVAVNRFDGQRSKANLAFVRGVHADLDGLEDDKIKRIKDLLQPSIEVRSSKENHLHLYWLLDLGEMLTPETTEAMNSSLVDLGADNAAKDISRLLRLPGFKHMKNSTNRNRIPPTVTVTSLGPSYSASKLKSKLLSAKRKLTLRNTTETACAIQSISLTTKTTEQDLAIVNEIAREISQEYELLWTGKWQDITQIFSDDSLYPSQSEADLALAGHIARRLVRRGISQELLQDICKRIFDKSALANRKKWSRRDYHSRTIQMACDRQVTTGNKPEEEEEAVTVDWSKRGDIRTSHLFAQMWRNKLIHSKSQNKWLRWDENRWKWCRQDEQIEHAKTTVEFLLNAATEIFKEDQTKGAAYIREAVKANHLTQINAMLTLSKTASDMSVINAKLDADPYQLGVQNGVVDLRSGQILENRPEFYVTRYCNAVFDDQAKCPRWLKFMAEVFKGDNSAIETVQRLLGYTLIGESSEEVIVFCVGFGANGKSILSNTVSNLLGDYNVAAPSSLLAARKVGDHSARGDVAMLNGKRLVSINELPSGMQLDEVVVKQLAGREEISARYLYGEFFSFFPKFTTWVRTNHKPIIKGDDDGLWRRIIVLPFNRKFTEAEQDTSLEAALLKERDGILQWMLEGTRLYLESGLKLSSAILAEQKQYRKESDLLGEFLEQKTFSDPAEKIDQSQLYFCWKTWNESCGTKPSSKKSFTQRLAERGFGTTHSGNVYYYDGLNLR